MSRTKVLLYWLIGLASFAVTLALHAPLILTAVPNGILDHQAAGTAVEVDRIQAAWKMGGVSNEAAIAMISDLIFIVIYGVASLFAGLYFRRAGGQGLRTLGTLVSIAAVTFLLTDLAETTVQLIQLANFRGTDDLAGLAATVRPVKMVAWIATFVGVIAGLLIDYRAAKRSA
ncbi:hypothetical protein [Altererythrobacter sp. ZODW24]|uniref:hypothetical protein n=1 Tax=Altererythrobacter sp. ZODW24 TaxID=2185142 RepID=UPI000DF750E2|nr:hypothetical protein [Altererythrobacter sp. ZODW24]